MRLKSLFELISCNGIIRIGLSDLFFNKEILENGISFLL